MSVSWTIDEFLEAELRIPSNIARNLRNLFESGYEVPFIARYRSHLIGKASTDDLRHAIEAYDNAKALKTKAEKMMKQIDARVKNVVEKESIKRALSMTMDSNELDILFEPFKKIKNGTLANRAMQLGIDVICQQMLRSEEVNLFTFVDSSKEDLNTIEKVEYQTINLLSHYIHRMDITQKFFKDVSANFHLPGVRIAVKSWVRKKAKALKPSDADFHLIEHFKAYISYDKDVRFVKDFQIMALERASSKGIIQWKVDVDSKIIQQHPCLDMHCHFAHREIFHRALEDSTNRFLIPSIERNLRRRLCDRAERSAIDCFAKNLRELLITEPLRGSDVLAIDPGFTHGCKCALVDKIGGLIDTGVFHLNGAKSEMDKYAQSVVKSLTSKSASSQTIIAIGNGKGSRIVQIGIAHMIKSNMFLPKVVRFCVVSECGASVYSASELAAEELRSIDINLRSAVSLARRIIDPISEYVKIAPKHLGIGSYQHSINEKRLDQMLDIVVRECVSNIGVDINAASLQILQKVSGLNKTTAANIIKYRQKNGKFFSREALKDITGIGPKVYEQCAGFLFIYFDAEDNEPPQKRRKFEKEKEYNPLDATRVHPESYSIAKRLLIEAGIDTSYIGSSLLSEKLLAIEDFVKKQPPEWINTWELLAKPVLVQNPPKLLSDVKQMDSLQIGEVVEGIVKNHAQFGLFVDIGVGFDALVHYSTFPPLIPSVNSVVKVLIKKVDMVRKRIEITLF